MLSDCVYRRSRKYDADAGEYVFMVHFDSKPIPVVPLRFSVIAGEVANQLRSCLDHLVCQLYLKAGGCDDKILAKLQFPIEDYPVTKEGKPSFPRGKIQHIGCRALAAVERLQPYNGATQPQDHPLSGLRELSNADKHRTLLVAVAGALRTGIELKSTMSIREFTESFGPTVVARNRGCVLLKDGAEVGRIPAPPDVEVNVEFDLAIAFEKVTFSELEAVIPRLDEIRHEVIKIIDGFEAKFF